MNDRNIIVADLEKYLTSDYGFSGAKLQLFGSSANGFGFQNSDMDISLTFDCNPTKQPVNRIKLIRQLADKLKRYHKCKHVFSITNTRVPIVKFSITTRDHLEVDLSFNNALALQNTKLLATYVKIDNRVKCLGYAMKYFVKLCDIADASQGSLSSYAYILMVLHFLQHTTPPVIPVLQELYDQSKPAPKAQH
ncbi:unnamed protein product [Meganyctiphanes norvegica]|uniref:Poly(A) RNA polymerase mitochondrial-like central palm domain-containing protein n=1 Tax=Meganyctiphanes norvegica TaxID=48144 RepID=A0AAV2S8S2_MEGNR